MMCDCDHSVSFFFFHAWANILFCRCCCFPNMRELLCWLTKVTVSHVCTLTGYQCYKRRCGGGSSDGESALEGDQQKGKDFALDNDAYECDAENGDHDGDTEKRKQSDKNTKL